MCSMVAFLFFFFILGFLDTYSVAFGNVVAYVTMNPVIWISLVSTLHLGCSMTSFKF